MEWLNKVAGVMQRDDACTGFISDGRLVVLLKDALLSMPLEGVPEEVYSLMAGADWGRPLKVEAGVIKTADGPSGIFLGMRTKGTPTLPRWLEAPPDDAQWREADAADVFEQEWRCQTYRLEGVGQFGGVTGFLPSKRHGRLLIRLGNGGYGLLVQERRLIVPAR